MTTTGICVTGFSYFNGKCYKLFDTLTNWDDAKYQCSCTGSYTLASITSAEENEFIKGLLSSGDSAWIGLNDKETQETYKWSDGTAFDSSTSYNNWDTNQPSNTNGKQDCVNMKDDGKWADIICTKDLKFVCKTSTASSTSVPVSTCTTPAPTTTVAVSTVSITIPPSDKCDSGWYHKGTKCYKLFSSEVL